MDEQRMDTIASPMEAAMRGLIARCSIPDPGDYAKDGLVYCGKCHTPKQALLVSPHIKRLFGGPQIFPIACECQREAELLREQLRAQEQAKADERERRAAAFGLPGCDGMTFEASDDRNAAKKAALERYCAKADEMLDTGMGVALTGDAGSGKTFFAACMAHRLLDNGYTVWMTSIPQIMTLLQGFDADEQIAVMRRVSRVDFLVLDDFGTERDTSYSREKVYEIINTRYQSGKPLIITTNMTKDQLANPQQTSDARVYGRITEMCPAVLAITGDRRAEIAERKRQLAREILLGGDE